MRVQKLFKWTHISEVHDRRITPLSQICSDLSLTPKKPPFSENFGTCMLTHIVKVVPPGSELYCIPRFLCLEIIGFTDFFNFEKNVFGFQVF